MFIGYLASRPTRARSHLHSFALCQCHHFGIFFWTLRKFMMGKRNEYSSSEEYEEEEEDKIQRRIRRLEEKLDRQKEKRRKVSSYRASSHRSSPRRSRSRSSRRVARRRSTTRSLSRYSRRRSQRKTEARRSRYRSSERSSSEDSRRRSPGRVGYRRSTYRSRSRTRARNPTCRGRSRSFSRSRHSTRRTSRREPSRTSRRSSVSRSASHELRRSSPRPSSGERVSVLTENNNDASTKSNERINDPVIPLLASTDARVSEDGVQTTPPVVTPAVVVPEHEVELQQDVLKVIGARLESDKKCSAAVHKDVALRWAEILKNGLPAEEVKKLLEKYPPPVNCAFISVPKLNEEIIAAIQESAIKRDNRIVEKQERLAACLAALGKAISISLKIEASEKIELLESLSHGA